MPVSDKNKLNVFRLLRIARNMRVKDVAEKLDITPAYIHAIENGEKFPSERLLRDYAEVLGVKEETILTFKPEEEHKTHRFENALLYLLKIICELDGAKE